VKKEEERGKMKRKLKGKGHKHTRGEKKRESRVWRGKRYILGGSRNIFSRGEGTAVFKRYEKP
jgi:hypothetical protein